GRACGRGCPPAGRDRAADIRAGGVRAVRAGEGQSGLPRGCSPGIPGVGVGSPPGRATAHGVPRRAAANGLPGRAAAHTIPWCPAASVFPRRLLSREPGDGVPWRMTAHVLPRRNLAFRLPRNSPARVAAGGSVAPGPLARTPLACAPPARGPPARAAVPGRPAAGSTANTSATAASAVTTRRRPGTGLPHGPLRGRRRVCPARGRGAGGGLVRGGGRLGLPPGGTARGGRHRGPL